MKERPILFSGPMIRALLAGTKTQTRRLCKSQPASALGAADMLGRGSPYGGPGDRLWVRETWAETWSGEADVREVTYRASTKPGIVYVSGPGGVGWRPSIFMRREDSRITLEVVAVRVERLQSITQADARAEGVTDSEECRFDAAWDGLCDTSLVGPRVRFAELWDAISGKRAPWSSNPWVWVLGFRRLTPCA